MLTLDFFFNDPIKSWGEGYGSGEFISSKTAFFLH